MTTIQPSDEDGHGTAPSFSQLQGYQAVPKPLELGELPQSARVRIWNEIYGRIVLSLKDHRLLDGAWHGIVGQLHMQYYQLPLDEMPAAFIPINRDRIKSTVLTAPFNRVMDLVEFVLRSQFCPEDLIVEMEGIFAAEQLAYVIEGDPASIVPAATRSEQISLKNAMQMIHRSGLAGAESHLKLSAAHINEGQWADSIHESINAVESVARTISPGTKSLQAAMQKLPSGRLHPALQGGMEKIYGYTSAEQGIRHALLDRREANVGQDEAVFMLGACASFASFLWRKHQAGEPA